MGKSSTIHINCHVGSDLHKYYPHIELRQEIYFDYCNMNGFYYHSTNNVDGSCEINFHIIEIYRGGSVVMRPRVVVKDF